MCIFLSLWKMLALKKEVHNTFLRRDWFFISTEGIASYRILGECQCQCLTLVHLKKS